MDIITRLNWVDVLIVIIMVRISYVALKDGLSHEIFPLVGAIITAAVSVRYYHELALLIKNITGFSNQSLDFLSLLFLITAMGFIFKSSGVLVGALIKVTWHPFVDKLGGLIFGVIKASIAMSLILGVLMLAPLPYFQYSIGDKSLLGPYFLKISPGISSKFTWMLPVIVK